MMELFYAERSQISADEIILDEFERKHVLQALRKSEGDEVFVTDGAGRLYRTRVKREKPLTLAIITSEQWPRFQPGLHLAIGFIRPARLEFALEKGTELGVRHFHLIRTQYSNYVSKNTNRYQKIVRQALKQSQQYYLPEITVHPSTEAFLEILKGRWTKLVAVNPEYPKLAEQLAAPPSDPVILFIGPEGGISEAETKALLKNGFSPVSLGKTRLRAETAAISGLSIIHQYIYQ